MWTTFDLPDVPQRAASAIDHRRGAIEVDAVTGLPTVNLGARITAEDVTAATDDA